MTPRDRGARFGRGPLVVAAALVIGLACQPDAFPDRLFLDDFETLCDGVPCGWEQTGGDAGRARWVETIHPGEHALELTDEVTVRRTNITPPPDLLLATSTIGVRAAVVCEEAARLELVILLAEGSGATREESVSLSSFGTEWETLSPVLMLSGVVSDPAVRAVILRKTGAGRCRIGELVIDVDAVDSASCG